MPQLTSLWRQLEGLLSEPGWNGDEVNPVVQEMAEVTACTRDELGLVMKEMVRFIESAPAQEAGLVALCAGTVFEYGGPPEDLYKVIVSRLPDVLVSAERLVSVVEATFPEPEEEKEEAEREVFWVGAIPVPWEWIQSFAGQDVQAVGAYNTLGDWCLPVISMTTRRRDLLTDLKTRDEMRAAATPLDMHGRVKWLLDLILVPLNEPLLFLH